MTNKTMYYPQGDHQMRSVQSCIEVLSKDTPKLDAMLMLPCKFTGDTVLYIYLGSDFSVRVTSILF